MKIETTRFGVQEVPDSSVIRFPDGLPGFGSKSYVLLHSDDNPLIQWLQSVDDPSLALMTVDPADLLLEYQPKVKPAEIQAIHPEDGVDKFACRVIIRVGDSPKTLFINLFAPLFINVDRQLAIQIPLVGSGYSVREVWPPASITAASPAAE